jgi:hypothetical protein
MSGATARTAKTEIVTVAEPAVRRPRRGANGEGVIDLAAGALKDIATLLQTELELLRAEIAEKLTVTAMAAALIGAGALLVGAAIVLGLGSVAAALADYGFSWPVAILIVAAGSLAAGAALVWAGVHNLSLKRLAPTKTVAQVQKDVSIAKPE